MTRERALPVALGAANLAAAALALWPWIGPGGPRATATAPRPREPVPVLANLPPAADFAAIAARPLFSPSRRPDAAAAMGGLSAHYRLIGVITDRGQGRVLVAPIAGGPAMALGEGDALAGWTLKRIDQAGALFASPAGEATLAVTPPR